MIRRANVTELLVPGSTTGALLSPTLSDSYKNFYYLQDIPFIQIHLHATGNKTSEPIPISLREKATNQKRG